MYLLTNLFEDMANSGINVELFAPTPTRGINKETAERYNKIKLEEKCNGKLRIHRFHLMREGMSIISRAIRYLLMNMKFIWIGIKTKADILFIDSTPPTQGLVAVILKKIKRIPVVYNLQDIFPDSMVSAGICTESSIVFKVGKKIERITYEYADKIVVISKDFKQNIMSKGVPESKIEVVYNWVDEQKVHYIPRDENILFDEYDLDRNKFYISYNGNIGYTQNMELLVSVAEEMIENRSIGFVLVGDGVYKKELEKQITEKNMTNVILIPFQPYERISEVFSIGHAGLIISKAGVGSNSVPSKTWSYMSAERPIIASFDENSELAEILTRNNCGISIRPDSKESLIEAIETLYGLSTSIYGKNGRQFIENNLTRKIGTKKYIDIILKTVKG